MNTSPHTMLSTRKRTDSFDKFLGYCWMLFLVSSIFYVFPSGMPQPSDWMLAGISFMLWVTGRMAPLPSMPNIMKTLLYFVIYTLVVNTTWAFIMQSYRFPLFSLFYLFNFIACLVFWSLYQRMGNQLLVLTAFALVVSSGIECAILVTSVWGFRNTGTFNNPNQLAYFAILVASIGTVLSRSRALTPKLQTFGIPFLYLTSGYASYASMSRSGLIVYVLAAAIGLVGNIRFTLLLCAGLIIALFASDFSTVLINVNEKVAVRFKSGNAGMTHTEEFLIRNGSQRIAGYPEYVILGAGEGDNTRFKEHCRLARNGYELHSTPGIIVFSYGIIGVFLSFKLLLQLYRKDKFSIIFVFSALAFSFTHNGLRQAEFWLLFVIIYIAIENVKWKRKPVFFSPHPHSSQPPWPQH